MKLLGIVNITRDSFSDGGRYLDPAAALAHARELIADGADILDIGAESTHPDAESVPAHVEIARLTPVVRALKADGVAVSIDTCKPAVMRAMLELGVDYINDVEAFQDPESVAAVHDMDCKLILMHRVQAKDMAAVTREHQLNPGSIIDRIGRFFLERGASLSRQLGTTARLIFDPGMGLFLSGDPAVSLTVLRELRQLQSRIPDSPILVSTSRKSFIGAVLADANRPRPVDQRGAGTLATELWAARCGVEYIRTHDPLAVRDAVRLWSNLENLARG